VVGGCLPIDGNQSTDSATDDDSYGCDRHFDLVLHLVSSAALDGRSHQ
jgi:hypothetical protein